MTKRFQQSVAVFLALCFALAGAVGTSPVLHQMVEHGGRGTAHTHFGTGTRNMAAGHEHRRGDEAGHLHPHAAGFSEAKERFAHSYQPFGLPKISLREVWHALEHFFEDRASSERPAGEEPGHEHRSLPEMLVNGLVDQHVEVPLVSFVAVARVSPEFPANTIRVVREWNAQTASRGPPVVRS